MKILILSSEQFDGAEVVSFQHDSGQGRAIWNSTLPPPITDETIDVELDVNVVIDVNAFDADFEKPRIEAEGELIVLDLVVESQDDDGMTYCRLSNDCLLMIEVSHNQKIAEGKKISLKTRVRDLEITPIQCPKDVSD